MGGGILAGITLILRSPYLLGLLLIKLLHTRAATLLYFEQGRIVAGSYADTGSRTRFFARVDLTASALRLSLPVAGCPPV
ncbi:hypothetical protein [Pseudomonas sp. KK4]|uniref:hypothetical protein n=1 Tax=Pseudomonas sp. KK4 TaxID=1855729 RepID=UPI00097BAA68|nr:hypothetical protein [Pseudomonas sp. KK4]